jgi:hypothetical protein
MTDLKPLSGAQLMTAEDFEISFGDGAASAQASEAGRAGPVTVAALERAAQP